MKKLKNKFGSWALVTGASSGIGEEFARQIASSGMNVILVARRIEHLSRLSKELIDSYGIETLIIEQDLSVDDASSIIAKITNEINIGLVISNADDEAMGGFLKRETASFENAIKLNLITPMKFIHHFLGKMYERQKGGLLIVSSGIAVGGAPHIADYSATKGYQLNFGQALHHEVKHAGVNVTVLMPGPTKTEVYERDDINFNKMPMPPMSTNRVVKSALKALIKNQPVIIPGMMNKVMDVMSRRIMSRKMTSRMFGMLMKGLIAPKYQY